MDECWQPQKELKESLSNTTSEDTMSLEEDELMSVSSNTTEFGSYCLEECDSLYDDDEDDDDTISCSTIQSDADDTRDFYYSENASRVKFAKMATKYLIMSLNEFTPEEIEDTWWTPNEREVLNKAHNKTVDRLEAGLKEKKSSPYRGLEKIAIEGYQNMVEAKNAYVDTVMDEMERQWRETDDEILDWEQIASLTRDISKQSTQEALTIALYDESQAREAYQTIKVKDLQEAPQTRPSISSISDIDGSSVIMAMLDDDNASQASGSINKLKKRLALDSSIRGAKEKKVKKKKAKGDKKKTTKTSENKEAEEGSSASDLYEGDGSLTDVEFDDDSGVFGSIEGGESFKSGERELMGEPVCEPTKKKKRGGKKKAKKEEVSTSDTDAVVVKKKKRSSSRSKKTASMEDETNFLLTKTKKKNPVSKFASTCVQRIRARAA